MEPIFSFFNARLEPRLDANFVEREDRDRAMRFIDALQASDGMFTAENHLRCHNSDEPEAIHLAQKYSRKLLDLYGRPPGVFVHCFALLKYGVGGGMAAHTDRMDPNCSDCVLSAVMYLNDQYQGGEIVFPRLGRSYHPELGTCISYPTLWPAYDHGVNTVSAGTRYVMAWCFTRNPDRAFAPYCSPGVQGRRPAGALPFVLGPDSTMMDCLNPTLLADPTLLEDVGRRLRRGQLVVIRDAFIPAFAEYVWRDLAREDVNWVLHEEYVDDGFSYSHHNIYDIEAYTPVMRETYSMFDHPDTKHWMARLSGRDCSGTQIAAAPSRYFPGDYSLPHADYLDQRSVAFVWHLSKNWDPSWGGAMYWAPDPVYQHASFNTLSLFSVTAHSQHCVTTVSRHAREKRLAFNGWWEASYEPTVADPLEDRYATPEERLTLTSLQSGRILEMDFSTVTDPRRRERLERLRAQLHAEQFVEPRSVHVIDLETSSVPAVEVTPGGVEG